MTEKTTDINEVYMSGRTLRYHARPEIGIFNQTTGDHSWGVLTLVVMLDPEASRDLILAAHFHDSGERWAGDLPYPFKLHNNYLAKKHAVTEARLARENGIPQFELTEKEYKLLKLCDRLEARCFVRFARPEILATQSWQLQDEEILGEAKSLGIYDKVRQLLWN